MKISLNRKLKGLYQLFRPELAASAGLCVVIGELLGLGAFPSPFKLVAGFLLGFFLSATALIINDYFDLEVDKVNAPQRPLPSGLFSRPEVLGLAAISALIGLASAWILSPLVFVLSLTLWVLGFFYNWKLKSAGIWGNLIVSLNVAMTFILGGIGVGGAWTRKVWVFGMVAFFFDLAEEIAADAMDAEGDQKRASRSIAILHGKHTALRITGMLLGLVVVLSWLPILLGDLGLIYLIAISLTDILIIFFGIKLLKSQTLGEGRKAIRGLYLSASIGLLAFLLGSFLG